MWRGQIFVIIICVFAFSALGISSEKTKIDTETQKKILKDHYDNQNPLLTEKGHYELAARIIDPVLDPGGKINIELYITGFGHIKEAKLLTYFSSDIFDLNSSIFRYGTNVKAEKIETQLGEMNYKISPEFGAKEKKLCDIGGQLGISFQFQKPEEKDQNIIQFTGSEKDSLKIFTENWRDFSPFQYIFKIKKSVKAGNYSINLYFTYYNGKEWKVSKQKIDFKIRNIIERNELITATLALLASLCVIVPNIKSLFSFLLKILKLPKD